MQDGAVGVAYLDADAAAWRQRQPQRKVLEADAPPQR